MTPSLLFQSGFDRTLRKYGAPANLVEKKFRISASPEVMDRFERFLSFFHYNGGHSGLFAMPFDGDGADCLKVSPAPPKENGKEMHEVSGSGADVEVAYDDSYDTKKLKRVD